MTDGRRDLEAFVRLVEALRPYLDDLVFVGGWAHFLYTLTPEAAPLGFTPLFTEDADVAAPLRLPVRGRPIPELLMAAGFEQRLTGELTPPVAEYVLGDEDSGFYVEFLAPLIGGELKRDGKPDATTKVGGVSAQKLRHLDVLLERPWKLELTEQLGFPVSAPSVIQLPNPASYIVQKVLVLGRRHPKSQPKDVLYLHDTFAAFTDAMPIIRRAWEELRPSLHRKHVQAFEEGVRAVVSTRGDLLRSASLAAAERPRAPTVETLRLGLRRGFQEGFGIPLE